LASEEDKYRGTEPDKALVSALSFSAPTPHAGGQVREATTTASLLPSVTSTDCSALLLLPLRLSAVAEEGIIRRIRELQAPTESSVVEQTDERGGVVMLSMEPSGETQFIITGVSPMVTLKRLRAEANAGREEKGWDGDDTSTT